MTITKESLSEIRKRVEAAHHVIRAHCPEHWSDGTKEFMGRAKLDVTTLLDALESAMKVVALVKDAQPHFRDMETGAPFSEVAEKLCIVLDEVERATK